jgi:hypothetical protein
MAHDDSFLHEVAQNLLHKERITLRLAVHQLRLIPTDTLATDLLIHAVHFVDGETAKGDA